jgi:hypothetical protein
MDRLVRKEVYDERDTQDFRLLQLHYGRLGAAFGRFIAVLDLSGGASNASVETVQSLLRVLDSEAGFAAATWLACMWLACMWLWLNDGREATRIASEIINGFSREIWGERSPRSDEEAVDAWISAAQVCILNGHPVTIGAVVDTYAAALDRAHRCGDVVRMARVAALYLLALAETSEDVPSLSERYAPDFAEAARVGDGFALSMRSLALGRWHMGIGGLALARTTDAASATQRALTHLQEAIALFHKQGMDPGVLFSSVQQAKVHADLHQFDEAHACLVGAAKGLKRFPIFASHVHEADGQLCAMLGDPKAAESFRTAVRAAEESGLLARREMLQRYVRQTE